MARELSDRELTARAPVIEYTSAKTLMAHGPDALHEHVSTRVEAAMGKALPQMEVRFKNLSISAELEVSSDNQHTHELPTIANEIKKGLRKFSAKKHRVTKHILKNHAIQLAALSSVPSHSLSSAYAVDVATAASTAIASSFFSIIMVGFV
ncbi:hypothetical protein ATCC90586_003731 [Pythium insidiosum]|nr:hypothetical protein ATCC90586_003731 [Pythium insidiosum]